jgi:[acyl-carrier-protein] S-malonyltransferase
MTKTAWVFPGQGSQTIGMGLDLLDVPEIRFRFSQADQILGWSVMDVCQDPNDRVSQTLYTQPCLYVIESLLSDLLKDRGQQPDYVAGHSLGEYTALYVAGVFSFEDGLRLIKRRAELMDGASEGTMAALLGCDRPQLETAIAQTPDVVLANDNNAGQVVISGKTDAVEAILSQVKSKRAVRLNVSGAFHSPLMANAAAQFKSVLDSVTFFPAQVPVLSNVDPIPSIDADKLKDRLNRQMTGSVRWREISLQLPQEGVDRLIEVGPGKVLTGIIKRTCPALTLENVGSVADLPQYANA